MEKLILRGVMYGADKIPDQWFEKVPGGYYKAKQEGDAEVRKDNKERSDRKSGANHNHNGSRPSTSGSGSGRNRRYSTGETMRPPRDSYRDDGHRSSGRRGDRRDRSSYDGQDDDDDYYSGDDRYRRRRHQGGEDRHRRRSYDNYDRYGDGDDRYGSSRPYDRDDDRRANGRPPYPDGYAPPEHFKRPDSAVYAAGAMAGGAAASAAAPYPPSDSRSPPPSSNGAGLGGGYVPYAHIYGQPTQQAAQQPFSPPPVSSTGSVQPNSMNQVAPPLQHYHRNPYAQEAAAAAAGAAAAETAYDAPRSQDSRYDPRYDDGYDRRYDDRYNGYDDSERPYSRSPSRQRRGRNDDDDSPPRRTRSERRPTDDPKRGKSQRGKSRLGEKFDTSQRGLGYGAVGALAGGLVGSEIGKGPIPTAIAAAVGAIGANAFEARERYVDNSHRKPPAAAPAQTQHLAPAHAGYGLPPPPPRRREEQRSRQYEAQGLYGGRDGRGREGGYYSD